MFQALVLAGLARASWALSRPLNAVQVVGAALWPSFMANFVSALRMALPQRRSNPGGLQIAFRTPRVQRDRQLVIDWCFRRAKGLHLAHRAFWVGANDPAFLKWTCVVS